MDPEQTDSLLDEFIGRVSPDIGRALATMDLPGKIQTIGKNNNLRIDQLGALEQELFMVLLGAVHPDQFVHNLSREARLTPDAANKITGEVNALIIAPIRASLVEMHEKTKLEKEVWEGLSGHELSAAAAAIPATSNVAPLPSAPAAPPPPLSTNIAQAKLSGNVHLPSDSVTIQEPVRVPIPKPSIIREGKYVEGVDPYREPIS